MRSSTTITGAEKNAYDQFCATHNILNDETPAAFKNGELIGGYICKTWNEDIKEGTLKVALEKLRDQLVFVPTEQVEVTAILAKLNQYQRDIVANWIGRQPRLESEGLHGFSNVSVLVAWILNRNFEVSEANLNTALGNCQNNGKRKLFWKEARKEDRSIVGQKINHALVNKSEEGFAPRSQTNRTYRQMMDDNRPKSETPVVPVSVNVEYKSKAESLVGRSHGQTDMARKLFVTVPGTSDIDWQQTLAAREKFLNTQAPLIRR
jgi:hypothetical protein